MSCFIWLIISKAFEVYTHDTLSQLIGCEYKFGFSDDDQTARLCGSAEILEREKCVNYYQYRMSQRIPRSLMSMERASRVFV